jgi:AcrR family transcriptional regulator
LAATDEPDVELRAADGRVPGRRGRATRQRLLECTGEMLRTTSYRDLKVIDIAREAGTSPATFYQYFADVEAAILVLAEGMAQSARLTDIVDAGTWKGRAGWDSALELVDEFIAFWDRHRQVLRVVDLSTDEGDQRFHKIRVRLLNEVAVSLARVIDGLQPGAGIDPMATAGVLVSMLAHVSAHHYGFEFWGIRTADVRLAMARQVYAGVTGQKPPG